MSYLDIPQEDYKIMTTTYLGRNASGFPRYEIVLNQSLGHTGRYHGMIKGLNEYVEQEKREQITDK